MSWELHLTGAILGVALAIVYRHWDVAPVKRYSWEDDDSVPEWFPQKEPPPQDLSREVSDTENDAAKLPSRKDVTNRDSE
jgi:hypothetical protein